MKLAKTLMAATAIALALPAVLSAEEVKKIGLAVPNLQADFFNQIKIGVENYAKEKGIEVVVVDAKNDTNTQVSQVQDIYIPAGAAAAAVPTRLAREAGIPVINVDRFPEGEPGDTFIGGEGIESSYQVCKHVIEKAGGSGKMAIIHGQKGTTPEVDRTAGCMRAIGENPGVELVDQQWTNMWSADEGFSITQNILQVHPDLKMIFGQADGIAMGAGKAVEGAGLAAQVVIGGYDGDGSALEYLAKCEGPFVVTATQSTRRMLAVAAGQEVPERQVSEAVLTTCENAAEFVANHP
jgi:ribose transport system substrate-binding protein